MAARQIRSTGRSGANGGSPEPCDRCEARQFSFCNALREEELGRLAAAAVQIEAEPGAALVRRGEPALHVFNVTSGVVRLSKLMPDGRRQVVGFLLRGDFLGFATTDTYTYEAEALTPVTACRFVRSEFAALLEAFPAMERRLLCMASDEIREGQEQMMLLGRKNAAERLASFLLKLARRQERLGAPSGAATLPMSRLDIADYLGLTPETISRMLAELRGRGLIALEGGAKVRMLRPMALQSLAEGEMERA